MSDERWSIERGDDPIVATAIHAGHDVRPEIASQLLLSEEGRLREEDPFTDRWVSVAANSISVDVSRFEVDLNRPREQAIYRKPADAWGLDLWRTPLSDEIVGRSLGLYDDFYGELGGLCDDVARKWERFVVLDLHSYNHRRGGPDAQADDPAENPELNVGTGTVDQAVWGEVILDFMSAIRAVPFDGGHLDVRENVRFRGGHMSRWINERYVGRGCAIAIEVKKIYMDEWRGDPDEPAIVNVADVLRVGAEQIRTTLTGTS